MSLLEDVFLEDEAGEAQELERVIEGDEYDERPVSPTSDDNEAKDDEAEEDKRRVEPGQGKEKRIIKNPRVLLNPARLTGPRGIHVIPDHFKDFKFKGKGHEKEDLDLVLKKLEHWAYRLFPKFEFKDCLKKIETLGRKRPVMVHLQKIRSDQYTTEDTVVQRDSSDDEAVPTEPPEEDEFDKLLQQQIDLARATPAPGSVRKPGFITPSSVDRSHIMPKATSSPSINEEQRERMLRNRRLAEERRLAKLKKDSNIDDTSSDTLKQTNHIIENVEIEGVQEISVVKKHNRSNIIDSSDEDEEMASNQSITVDVHDAVDKKIDLVCSKTNVPAESDRIDVNTYNECIEKEQPETEIVHDTVDKEENLIVEQNEGYHDDVINKSINPILDTENDSINKENEVGKNNDSPNNEDFDNILETHSKNDKDMPNTDEKVNINTPLTSNKENIDVNAVEEIMDIDFNDDF